MKENKIITLELTPLEAGILLDITNLIGGDPDISARKLVEDIMDKLESMNIEPLYDYTGRPSMMQGYLMISDDIKLFPEPLKIGEYRVTNFSSEGFDVGCEHISWEAFDKISDKRKKYRRDNENL